MKNKQLLLVVCMLLSSLVRSQQIHVKHFNKAAGSPSNFINDLCFDQEGRAVLATDVGLYSFNGFEYHELRGELFITQLQKVDQEIYYSVDNQVFTYSDTSVVVQLPEDEVVMGFIVSEENHLFVLSQYHYYEIIDSKYTKLPLDGALKILASSDPGRPFILKRNSIVQKAKEGWDTLYESEIDLMDVFFKEDELYVVHSEGYEILSRDFKKLNSIGRREVGTVTSFDKEYNLMSSSGYVELVSDEGRKPLFRHAFAQKIEKCVVDEFKGVWFLTQGGGLYFAENPSIQIFLYYGFKTVEHEGMVLSEGAIADYEEEEVLEYVFAEESWKGKKIYVVKSGCYFSENGNLRDVDYISKESILDIVIDQKNDILYGKTESKGVVVIDLNSREQSFIDVAHGLSHNYVRSWTMLGDTLIVKPKRGKLNFVHKGVLLKNDALNIKENIEAQVIRASDEYDVLTFYNANGGLSVYNLKNDSILQLQAISGARFVTVHKDQLIFISNTLIQFFNLKTHTFQTEHLPYNLSNTQIGYHFSFKDDMLRLRLSDGVLMVDLANISTYKRRPRFIVSEMILNGNSVPINDVYRLSYGENDLRIKMEYIDFVFEGRPKLYWNMSGVKDVPNKLIQDRWMEAMLFTDGEYKLQFLQEGSSLREEVLFVVEKPIWKKIWFWVVVMMLLLVIITGIIRWKTFRLRKDKERLTKLVDQKTAEIQERNKDVEQIAYALSHDFKTPLNSISSLIGMLTNEAIPADKKTTAIEMLGIKSDALTSNMEGLIDLLKINAKEQEFELIDLAEVLREIQLSLQDRITEKKAVISLQLEVSQMNGIRPFVYSIFHNLIGNSLKYGMAGRAVSVSISASLKGGDLLVTIIDNGKGMDLSNDSNAIFRPFKQINPKAEGVGLGLSIVKRMVDVHQGQISFKSKLGEGTTVALRFPKN